MEREAPAQQTADVKVMKINDTLKAQVCHIFVCVYVLRVAAESGSSHPVVCEWVNV